MEKYGAGLSPEQRLTRLEQLLLPQSLLTTRGDIIARGASIPERLALGAVAEALISDGTDATWGDRTAVAMGSFGDPGSTGVLAVTGVGFTPKLVIFAGSFATGTASHVTSIGAMTASSQFTVGGRTSSVDRYRYRSAANCLNLMGADSSTPDNLAAFSAFGADGFSVNFSARTANSTWYWTAIG